MRAFHASSRWITRGQSSGSPSWPSWSPDCMKQPDRVDASDILVFLGPSLPADEARRILPARYLPPVRCGDVLHARRMKPRAIAIIDGLFELTASVWHKEILLALEDGIA